MGFEYIENSETYGGSDGGSLGHSIGSVRASAMPYQSGFELPALAPKEGIEVMQHNRTKNKTSPKLFAFFILPAPHRNLLPLSNRTGFPISTRLYRHYTVSTSQHRNID
jgi:hypothetical protein